MSTQPIPTPLTTLAQASDPQFPRDQYLLPPRTGTQRVSSWVDGRQRALVFFWEDPETRIVKLVRTQAPYITETLQRFFGTTVDGKFGELTRAAIVRHARAHGVNFAINQAAASPLLAYALQAGFMNGGRVAFPPAMAYPDTNHPVLATSPDGRRYSTVFVMDLDSGEEVPFVPGPHGGVVPANVPPPSIPPTQPLVHSLPSQGQTSNVDVNDYSRNTTNTTTNTSSATSILSGNTVQFPTQVGTVQQGSQQANPQPPPGLSPLDVGPSMVVMGEAQIQALLASNPFLSLPLPDGTCPKGFVPVGNGLCKREAFIRLDGWMLLPNAADIVIAYGQPETYANVFGFLKKKDDKDKAVY